jgi:hypothetical protein
VKKPNEIPRLGGDFIWQQAVAARNAGAGAMKIAMFDEVNEATAMFKVVSKRSQSPAEGFWLALDGDGKDLPSDWYLRLSYEITKIAHGVQPPSATIPIKPTDPFSLAVREDGIRSGTGSMHWTRGPEGLRFKMAGYSGTIEIRDVQGGLVRTLQAVDGAAAWDYRDQGNSLVTPGVYAARLGGGASVASTLITMER